MISSEPQPAGAARPAKPRRQQSLALRPIVEALGRRRRATVLDLGPANGANVEFFAHHSCRLYIADLYRSLGGTRLADAPGLERRLDEMLPRADSAYDLILSWDLFNHFSADEIAVLGRHLAGVCSEDALLFAMIYTRPRMAATPLAFRVEDEHTLAHDPPPAGERETPRYVEPALERMLPLFGVHVSFLLRNGTQEYLFHRLAVMPPPAASP